MINTFIYRLLCLVVGIMCGVVLHAQEPDSTNAENSTFTDKMLQGMGAKATYINDQLEDQSSRYLKRIARQEAKLQKKMAGIDSLGAKQLFSGVQEKYAALAAKTKKVSSSDPDMIKGVYSPYLDSLKGGLSFLNKNPKLLSSKQSLEGPLKEVNKLQNSLQNSADITAFLKERKQQIGQALKKYTELPKGITKSYGAINKNVYYYGAQVKEYKELLKDPSKLEQKALEVLRKIPAFQSFMQQNSMLASMFATPENYGTPEALAGLQTRSQVQQLIGSRLGSGPSAQGVLEQNLQSAQTELSQLKNKINQLGGSVGNSDMDMPDFRPNSNKTKTFAQRIEYGSNLQTARSSNYFPTTTDIGLSAGYKLNDKSVIGVGVSYKLGWGKDIKHINFSHQGVGLRSFLEYKIKGSFWLSGGAEMNHKNSFSNFQGLKQRAAWQQSALIGLSKKYQLSKKVKGSAQVLYDFLWKKQIPRAQPVVFRVSYILK